MKTTLLFAYTQLLRILRDPVTLIVLFTIPSLLLVLFGAFTANTDNIQLRVAVINHSKEAFAEEFESGLKDIKVLKHSEEKLSIDAAKDKMKNDELDGVIEIPAEFGQVKNDLPSGNVKVYFDQTDATTGDIVSSVIREVIDGTNTQLVGNKPPLGVEKVSISGANASVFDGLFAMFTGMAVMMVGIFGVASALAYDKKAGILRRLRITPFKSWQLIVGTMLAYTLVSVTAVALMTGLAMLLFGLEMRGSWLDFGILTLLATLLMLGFGLAVGGWAKNATQADIYGQIVFIASLAFSGIWVPIALMPTWLQDIVAYLPLTPVIDGIRSIVTEGLSLASLTSELLVIVVWTIVVLVVGIKTFKWE